MAHVIHMNAPVETIEEHVQQTLKSAEARGGSVAALTDQLLVVAAEAISPATAERRDARRIETATYQRMMDQDHKAVGAMRTVRDAMSSALQRPGVSPYMDQVFPAGLATYTKSHPHTRPTLMRILHKRILAAKSPAWSKADLSQWAAIVRARQPPLALAVYAHREAEIQCDVADAVFRSSVRTACFGLHVLKRALIKHGLTVAEVHEIIPDASLPAPGGPNDVDATAAPELLRTS